ncbi:hypothetical protein U724_00115 [Pseudomonas chlororaphis subsp. aurantiaca PB-St2]|nr:hypothetical protein U724_00115 [Pseudomonas chlororaphis subsp. aurantiaca PB-St2]
MLILKYCTMPFWHSIDGNLAIMVIVSNCNNFIFYFRGGIYIMHCSCKYRWETLHYPWCTPIIFFAGSEYRKIFPYKI